MSLYFVLCRGFISGFVLLLYKKYAKLAKIKYFFCYGMYFFLSKYLLVPPFLKKAVFPLRLL